MFPAMEKESISETKVTIILIVVSNIDQYLCFFSMILTILFSSYSPVKRQKLNSVLDATRFVLPRKWPRWETELVSSHQ